MKRKKILELIAILALIILPHTGHASPSNFEIYTAENFAMKFVVNNKAENVQFAYNGISQWTSAEILETTKRSQAASDQRQFTFYVMDKEYNSYQIDYYKDQYIWVYKIEWPSLQIIGERWKLHNQQEGQRITLSGFVYNYDPKTKVACFFTDLEMVEQGVARNISAQLTETCFIERYGFGAILYFGDMPTNKYYKKPIEGLLMDYLGSWKVKDGKSLFYVHEIQPYF